MFDGGSLVFWYEYFQPKKLIGIDLSKNADTPYFQAYLASHKLQQTIHTYWGIDQANVEQLTTIIHNEFEKSLDLVIDDASHLYSATKTSFETLFPLLRSGGLYIIEDWAWGHWKACQSLWHPNQVLTKFVAELIEATGSSPQLIASLTVFEGFTVIERGHIAQQDLQNFHLDRFITPLPSLSQTRPFLLRLHQKMVYSLRACLCTGKEFFRTLL